MANFDDIFTSTPEQENAKETEKAPFDKDAWAEQKQKDREAAFSMIEDMAESIRDNGNLFQDYLNVQARFDRYSVGNALLVAAQMPEATRLADFETWKDSGVYVQRGESGITLLGAGNEYEREDGSIGVSFNVKKVFDVSQTNSKYRNVQPMKMDERAVITALTADFRKDIQIDEFVPEDIGAGYDAESKKIYIRPGMDGDEIIRKLSMALAAKSMSEKEGTRNVEFKAYCVSYMVARRTGMDVSKYSFDRLPESYKSMEAKDIRSELGDIRDTAHDLIDTINRNREKTKSPKNRDEAR